MPNVRSKQTLNSGWRFAKADRDPPAWEIVNLPHTWNARDLIADERDAPPSGDDACGAFAGYGGGSRLAYYRGEAWYEKELHLQPEDLEGKLYLYFDGANQDAVVYLNRGEAGRHYGGFTGFCVDITHLAHVGDANLLNVRLSNAHNEEVAPLGGDLGHFGGLYRYVHLVRTGLVHFDMMHCGSCGVLVDTPDFAPGHAPVRVRARLVNESAVDRTLVVRSEVCDAEGKSVTALQQTLVLEAGAQILTCAVSDSVPDPHPWSPDHPYVYCVLHRILDSETGDVLDELSTPLGFRAFSVDVEQGFFLNGERCFLRGIGRHQDYAGLGYAVPYEVLHNDVCEIKALGANAMRGHYPLAGEIYDSCDRLGVMCWVKSVIMDRVSMAPEFRDRYHQTLREMVLQLYNHPAVIMWGYACEPLGDADWFWPKPQHPGRLQRHFHEVRELMAGMETLIKELDPYRLTANDFHTDPNPQWNAEAGLTEINDFNGWNLYFGWYHGSIERLPEILAQTRTYAPRRPYLIAEFGAGTDTRVHTHEPTLYDMTPEHADRFHKAYLAAVETRPWIAGMFIWTLVDFQRNSIGDSMKHINNKGLLTGDRRRKDTFYLYKAHWNPEPMVHIAEHDWPQRLRLDPEASGEPIQVYSNCVQVELIHNGKSLGVRRIENKCAVWNVPLTAGRNSLLALSRDPACEALPDHLELNVIERPRKLCINLGQSRTFFHDPLTGDIWAPDRPYAAGAYGHLEGRFYRVWKSMAAWHGIREGVRHNIRRTELLPVFQTFLVGLRHYRIDLPDSLYRVSLCLTEPFPRACRRDPNEQTGADPEGRRVFDIQINGRLVMKDLDLAERYGERNAVMEHVVVRTRDNQGVRVELVPHAGEPLLCGLAVEDLERVNSKKVE